MISMNVSAPAFILVSGVPVILPERSSTSAISVGLVTISGAAVSARVTRRVPSHSIRSTLIVLLELVMPIQKPPFGGFVPPTLHSMYVRPVSTPFDHMCRYAFGKSQRLERPRARRGSDGSLALSAASARRKPIFSHSAAQTPYQKKKTTAVQARPTNRACRIRTAFV